MEISLAVALGWLLTIVVHLNTLRRNALQSSRDALIKDIYELIDGYNEENKTIEELFFDHKITRVDRKIIELNSIYNGTFMMVSDESIERLVTLELDDLDKNKLNSICFEAIERIDQVYYEKILRRFSFICINRYEIIVILLLMVIFVLFRFQDFILY